MRLLDARDYECLDRKQLDGYADVLLVFFNSKDHNYMLLEPRELDDIDLKNNWRYVSTIITRPSDKNDYRKLFDLLLSLESFYRVHISCIVKNDIDESMSDDEWHKLLRQAGKSDINAQLVEAFHALYSVSGGVYE